MRFFLACLFSLIVGTSAVAQYDLTIESFPAVQEGLTTYRFYVNMEDATDRMSAVYGNSDAALSSIRLTVPSTAHLIQAGMPRASTPLF